MERAAGESRFFERLEAVWRRVAREELIRFTRNLVRIPSDFRPDDPEGNEARAARYVADYLDGEGFEVRTEEVSPGRPNVWALWHGNRPGKTLLFEGHTDVATEGRTEEWRYSPFGADLVGSRIYGRGSCDTKGNMAAAVMAVRAIKDSGVPFAGRLLLCHPVDEEGMMSGIKHFIRQGHAEGVDGAVICEPEENQLCVAQKGAMRVEVTVQGKMAHGAMPRSGVNPVTRAARFVVAVEALELDMRHTESVRAAAGEIGTPDVLVSTPSINVRKPLLEITDEEFDRVVDLNLKETFRLVREFGQGMAERGSGSVIAFSSIRAQVIEPGQGVYAATKAGTLQMFPALAAELEGQSVRVTSWLPV